MTRTSGSVDINVYLYRQASTAAAGPKAAAAGSTAAAAGPKSAEEELAG